MEINVAKELAALRRMSVSQLRERYAKVFGEVAITGNRTWLVRRIAWRIQVNAEGDLSERARQRAAELARRGPADHRTQGETCGVTDNAGRHPHQHAPTRPGR